MDDEKILGILKNFVGEKTTFKKISEDLGLDKDFLINEIFRLDTKKKLSYLALGDGKIRIGAILNQDSIEKTNLKKPKQTTRMIKISCMNWRDCPGATDKSKKNSEGLIFRISSRSLYKIINSTSILKCPACSSIVEYDKSSLPLGEGGETIISKKRID